MKEKSTKTKNNMKKVLIFGGTGFLGQSLADYLLQRNYEVVVLGRHQPKEPFTGRYIYWDAVTISDYVNELEGATAIVNLAGRTVNCIKTLANCDVILRSRVDSVKAIAKALELVNNPPKVWVQMSTAHIYGDPPTQVCTEESTFGYGLAPTVGKAWEQAFRESKPEIMRGVLLRTSFVIGKGGGALLELTKMAKIGLGGKVGHGQQGVSWIHERDMNEIFLQAIERKDFEGVYIASSPNPVSNQLFMNTLRKVLNRPFALPAPAWLTKIGAKYIFQTDPELAIYGRYVKPKRLLKQDFSFQFENLTDALQDLLD